LPLYWMSLHVNKPKTYFNLPDSRKLLVLGG
jgi:hypothetical protein